MRVAVCDDENNDLNCALDLLKEYDTAGALELFPFSEAESLVASAATEPFDLVILDIEMPHMNGYEAAQKLVRMPDKPLVIFLTNSMDYSLRGYGLVFRYLSKPLDKSLFYTAMDAARQEIQAHRFVFVSYCHYRRYLLSGSPQSSHNPTYHGSGVCLPLHPA